MAEANANVWDRLANAWRRCVDSATIAWTTSTVGQVTAAIVAGSVNTTQLADGAVTNAKLATDAVSTIKIQADAVTYAKIQNISATQRVLGRNSSGSGDTEEVTLTQLLDWIGSAAQGDILYRGASAWARLAAGTSGQFLKTNGTGADPAWASQAGGGITTIASGNLPAAATQPITGIPATYAYLVLHCSGVSSNTATRFPLVRLSVNNGSSYDATLANYESLVLDNGGLVYVANSAASLIETPAQAAAATWEFTIELFNYHAGPHTTYRSRIKIGGGVTYWQHGTFLNTSAIDALQILWNGSGNFDAGTYALYGIS